MTNPSRRIRHISDKEEAEIQRKIASDPDAPEATEEQLRQAKPFAEAFPTSPRASSVPGAGQPSRSPGKQLSHPLGIRTLSSITRRPAKAGRAE